MAGWWASAQAMAAKAAAVETLRLSHLTLPHAFARVLLAEALCCAQSLPEGCTLRRK